MRKRLITDVLTYVALAGFALFSMGPILWTFLTSLKSDVDIVKIGVDYWPHHPTLTNYVEVWRQSAFPTLLLHSVIVTASTAVACVVLGTPAAFVLSRLEFRGKQKVLLALIATRMLPLVLIVPPLFTMLRTSGLIDTLSGLVFAYTALFLPLHIWMLKYFFDAVPTDISDAAQLDGASPLSSMVRIAIPIAMQGFLANIFSTSIGVWNEYLFALMLTTSQGSRTWPVGLQMMVGNFQLPWGALAAGGILSVAPVALIVLIARRIIIAAMAAGDR